MMRLENFIYGLLIIGLTLVITSCDDNSLGKLREQELDILDKYIQENNITVRPTSSGLYYIEKQAGIGDTIQPGNLVHVYYRTFRIRDNQLIDQNITEEGHYYDPLRFQVAPVGTSTTVISGLNEAVQLMKENGRAEIIVPSQIAYGQNGDGTGAVPAFTTLRFEVWVKRVVRASAPEE
jgi:FKBP-type peptidyl-prolyl cis-trans isomerase FkpA